MTPQPAPSTAQLVLAWLGDWRVLTILCLFVLALLTPAVRDGLGRWIASWRRPPEPPVPPAT